MTPLPVPSSLTRGLGTGGPSQESATEMVSVGRHPVMDVGSERAERVEVDVNLRSAAQSCVDLR